MPIQVQILTETPPTTLEATLAKLFARYVTKIRTADVQRLRGRRTVALSPRRVVAAQLEPDEDPVGFIAGLVAELVQIASDDADGQRVRYRFAIYGEPAPGSEHEPPELTHHDDFVDGIDSDGPQSREGELINAMKVQSQWGEKMSAKHLELVDKVNATITTICDLASKLGDQVSKADGTRAEYEFKIFEKKLDAEKEVFEAQMDERRSEMAWSTIRDLGNQVIANLEMLARIIEAFAAARGGAPSSHSPAAPPSDDELESVLGDPDLITLSKKIRDTTDTHERIALASALKSRWAGLLPEQRMMIIAALNKLPEQRRTELARWFFGLGIVWT